MTPSSRTLLDSVVDYAGMFPPANLGLADALRRYAEHRCGPHAWMLGSFVLASSRLGELEDPASLPLSPSGAGPWPLTIILAKDPSLEMERVESFSREWRGGFRVAAVEFGPLEPRAIETAAGRIPPGLDRYFEAPLDAGLEDRLAAIAACGAAAKVRMGGTKREAFPGAMDVARFLRLAARRGVPFKATAGLHHPFQGERRLSEDPSSPLAPMHGFVNLAVAACLAGDREAGPDEALRALEEPAPAAFRFLEDGVEWRGRKLGLRELADARRSFFRSFGSCSFQEPVDELEELRIL